MKKGMIPDSLMNLILMVVVIIVVAGIVSLIWKASSPSIKIADADEVCKSDSTLHEADVMRDISAALDKGDVAAAKTQYAKYTQQCKFPANEYVVKVLG